MSFNFSPDGKLLLSGSRDGTARLWNVETGEQIERHVCYEPDEARKRYSDASSDGNRAVFSPDGKLAALATMNYYDASGVIHVWRIVESEKEE
jgi:WD40 repeat protein